MSLAFDQPADKTLSQKPFARPIAIWLAVQLIAVFAIVARVPFALGDARDQNAPIVMIVTQCAMSSLLFDALFQGLASSIVIVLVSIPMGQLVAGFVAVSVEKTVLSASAVVIWLTILAMWGEVANRRTARRIVTAIASALSIGGWVALYARTEFVGPTSAGWFGPIAASLAQLGNSRDDVRNAWIFLVLCAIVSAAVCLFALRARDPSRTPTSPRSS